MLSGTRLRSSCPANTAVQVHAVLAPARPTDSSASKSTAQRTRAAAAATAVVPGHGGWRREIGSCSPTREQAVVLALLAGCREPDRGSGWMLGRRESEREKTNK